MKKQLLLFALLLIPCWLSAQRYTVSGTITDAATGETLIGASIVDSRSGKGSITNEYGHFSLSLPKDSVDLKISYVGYLPQHHLFFLSSNRELSAALSPNTTLKTVEITTERIGDTRSSQMSAAQLSVEKIKSVPVLFGEADVIKALQLMPGVQSGSEGSSGMYVRGGGPDENLFLLDGVALYNVTHLGGFFSAFNTDAVKNVTLYKGSFPARFGGRLSAVLDVTQNNGNDKELHGNASIGLISAKVNIEGPLIKEKTTFSISARRTYAELLFIPVVMHFAERNNEETMPDNPTAENAKFDAGYYFYDLNAKITHKFNNKSRLYASFYAGEDFVHGKIRTVTSLNEDMYLGFENGWGNLIGSLRWNRELSPKLFLNLSTSYTQYRNSIIGNIEKVASPNDPNPSTMEGDYRSGIKEMTTRADFDFVPNPNHNIKFGVAYIPHWFQPEVAKGSINYFDSIQMNQALQFDTTILSEVVHAQEMVAFLEDDWTLSPALKLNAGLHASLFHVQNTTYPSLQPRLSARLLLAEGLSLKAGYAFMTQYVHLLSTSSITLPTDLWVPVTDLVKPMNSHQVAAGLFYTLPDIADFSIEGYYKHMDNLIEYKDGATFFGSSESWEKLVYAGQGWSYGVEFLVQREFGDFTGWVGYTWSRTMRLFDREGQVLNNGDPFPAKYDRRHDLSIVLSYKFTPSIDASLTWVFTSGNAVTLATQRYAIASDDPDHYLEPADGYGVGQLSYIDGRNNYRMPNYHRMDASINFHRQFKRCHRTINVSVYNLYNRKNPYMIYQSPNERYGSYSSSLMQLSIFPIIPSVAYTFYF